MRHGRTGLIVRVHSQKPEPGVRVTRQAKGQSQSQAGVKARVNVWGRA